MKVSFKNKKEYEFFHSEKLLRKVHGFVQAKMIIRRLGELREVKSLTNLSLGCKFHEHKRDRKGLFSINLFQPYRLIFESVDYYSIVSEINHIKIIEVMNLH